MIGIGFLLIAALSPVFSEEYDRKMDALILTSRHGKRRCVIAKVTASYLFALLVTGATLLFLTLAFLKSYGLSGGEASIQLSGRYYMREVPYFLTSLGAAGLSLVLWIAGTLILTGVILILSSLCRTAFFTLIASLAFYMVPMLLNGLVPKELLSLTPFWTFMLEKPLEIPKTLPGFLSYVWIIAAFSLLTTALSLHCTRKFFSTHQPT